MTTRNIVNPLALSVETVSAQLLGLVQAYAMDLERVIEYIFSDLPDAQISRALDMARSSNSSLGQSLVDLQHLPADSTLAGDEARQLRDDLARAKGAEDIVMEWLAVAPRPLANEQTRLLDKLLGLKSNPRYDLYIAVGESAAALKAELAVRNYARVICEPDLSDPLRPLEPSIGALHSQIMGFEEIYEFPPQTVRLLGSTSEMESPQCLQLLEDASSLVSALQISRNTLNSLGRKWTENLVENIPELLHRARTLAALKNAAEGATALLVGAGPTLDTCLSSIKSMQPRPLIVCAYKALKSLVRAGITPDFVLILDPNMTMIHMEGAEIAKVGAFVVEASTNSQVLAALNVPVYPFTASEPVTKMCCSLGMGELPRIATGGSVVHAGIKLLRHLGCRDIGLVGIDLAYPNHRYYAAAAGEADKFVFSTSHGTFSRQSAEGDHKAGRMFDVAANNGGVVSTSSDLDMFRRWIEQYISSWQRETPRLSVWNASFDGARIAGADYRDIALVRPSERSPRNVQDCIENSPLVFATDSARQAVLDEVARRQELMEQFCRRLDPTDKSINSDLSIGAGLVIELSGKCPELSVGMAAILGATERRQQLGRTSPQELLASLLDEVKSTCTELSVRYDRIGSELTRAQGH